MKISHKVKTLAAGSASVIASALTAASASATTYYCPGTNNPVTSLNDCSDVGGDNNDNNLITMINAIINTIIAAVGFVAVVVIILGGVNYTTSAGDPGKVKKAKDTILYGIIGLVIALLAFAIVNFVLSSLLGGSGS